MHILHLLGKIVRWRHRFVSDKFWLKFYHLHDITFLVKSQKKRTKRRKNGKKQGKGKGKEIKDADRKIGKREVGTKLGEKGVKVLFWNVQGLRKKEKEFWYHVGKFDVVRLVETWVQRENWE